MIVLDWLLNVVLIPFGIVYFALTIGTLLFVLIGMLCSGLPGIFIEAYLFYACLNYIIQPLFNTPEVSYSICVCLIVVGRFLERLFFLPKPPPADEESFY